MRPATTTSELSPAQRMRRFVITLFAALGVSLVLILVMNLLLGAQGLGSVKATHAASVWQQTTRGITYAPPISITRPFKALRLADRLPDINALVLGSSALMGVTDRLFPASWRTYNLTLTGNSTASVVAEAEYIEANHARRIRWMLIGLDWSVGMIYLPGIVNTIDLAPDAYTRAYTTRALPLHKRLEDALSWPRVATLGSLLLTALTSDAPLDNLRRTFTDVAGAEYHCADGALARDFDVINRGLCRGYRYDGSWTFANDSRLTPTQAATLSIAATAESSKYTKHLCATQGEPNPEFMRRFGETARRFEAKGGRMIFVLPPLAPGMEMAMRNTPRWKTCLDRTKSSLDAWARRYHVSIIDAGASERYGCRAPEFADEHHAYPECNQRVLRRFFRDQDAGLVGAGLYQPEGA